MIIQRLEIISFGKFKDKTIDFSEGFNVIYGDNESGKSTIIDFIYAMLYGFGDNRGKALSLREKYTPWDGGTCEGKLTAKTDDGNCVTIYRKAGNAKKYDILRVYNPDTGEEISTTPEKVIGINSDTFFKTVCIKQLSTAFDGNNTEISQKLSNISAGGDENINFEKAIRLLDNVRREIRPQRGSGGMLAKLTQDIANCERNNSAQQNIKTELELINQQLPKAEHDVITLKQNYENLLKTDYTSAIAHLSGRIEEKHKSVPQKPFLNIFVLSAIIMIALFAVTFVMKFNFSVVFLAVSVVFLITGFLNKKTVASNDVSQLISELGRLQQSKEIHDKKLILAKENLSKAQDRLSQFQIRKQTLSLSLTGESTDIDTLYTKKRSLERKLQTVSRTIQALNCAHEKMQRDFTPTLNTKASEYFSSICGGKYTRIFCSEEFGISIDNGLPRESSYFSGGTVDQLYLSVRLALIDMLFKESSCPLLLDQPFLQYDEFRKKNTVSFLKNLPKNRQTLLFTGDKNVILSNKHTEILT